MDFYTPALSFLGAIIVAYFSYRIGKVQSVQLAKSSELSDKTLVETEFRKSLLELLDQNEEKMSKQETKIERMDALIEQSKQLADELKRANFQLTIENQRLQREIESLQREVAVLRAAAPK